MSGGGTKPSGTRTTREAGRAKGAGNQAWINNCTRVSGKRLVARTIPSVMASICGAGIIAEVLSSPMRSTKKAGTLVTGGKSGTRMGAAKP
jgi:hypothetical protein